MNGFWIGDVTPREFQPNSAVRSITDDQRQRIRDLEYEVQRVKLLNQALWELLRDKVKLTDAELEQKISDIDLRDGVADGKITDVALKCPSCSRVSSSKHWKCLYCGQEFEKPVMG